MPKIPTKILTAMGSYSDRKPDRQRTGDWHAQLAVDPGKRRDFEWIAVESGSADGHLHYVDDFMTP